jgi:hypothetical protein
MNIRFLPTQVHYKENVEITDPREHTPFQDAEKETNGSVSFLNQVVLAGPLVSARRRGF